MSSEARSLGGRAELRKFTILGTFARGSRSYVLGPGRDTRPAELTVQVPGDVVTGAPIDARADDDLDVATEVDHVRRKHRFV